MQLSGIFRHFSHPWRAFAAAALALSLLAPLAAAQQPATGHKKTRNGSEVTPSPGMSQMPGMKMGTSGQTNMQPQNFIQEIMAHNTSGTSAEPDSTPIPMLMTTKDSWTLMFHANVFVLDE